MPNNFQNWCKERETVLDFDPSACPQLNGRAEMLNSTSMNKVKTILFDSDLNEEMQGEAL